VYVWMGRSEEQMLSCGRESLFSVGGVPEELSIMSSCCHLRSMMLMGSGINKRTLGQPKVKQLIHELMKSTNEIVSCDFWIMHCIPHQQDILLIRVQSKRSCLHRILFHTFCLRRILFHRNILSVDRATVASAAHQAIITWRLARSFGSACGW